MRSILGIGTDIVAIERFKSWSVYSEDKLLRVFGRKELAGCLLVGGTYCPERLAARFAAKEAFYKALSSALVELNLVDKSFSFLSICPLVQVIKEPVWQVPQLIVDWKALCSVSTFRLPLLKVHLSFAHEQHAAVAFVIITL